MLQRFIGVFGLVLTTWRYSIGINGIGAIALGVVALCSVIFILTDEDLFKGGNQHDNL